MTPTAPKTNGRTLPDWRLAKALAHPVRSAILDRLAGGRRASASDLAEEFDLELPGVAYHVRELADAGLIEQDGPPVQRRGALERYYRRARHVPAELHRFADLTRAIAGGQK